MTKKQTRPNRIVKLPRDLFNLMAEIAFFQEYKISTNKFIVEILMEIGNDYGKKMQKEAMNNRGHIVGDYLQRSGVLNNPEENNRFQNIKF